MQLNAFELTCPHPKKKRTQQQIIILYTIIGHVLYEDIQNISITHAVIITQGILRWCKTDIEWGSLLQFLNSFLGQSLNSFLNHFVWHDYYPGYVKNTSLKKICMRKKFMAHLVNTCFQTQGLLRVGGSHSSTSVDRLPRFRSKSEQQIIYSMSELLSSL